MQGFEPGQRRRWARQLNKECLYGRCQVGLEVHSLVLRAKGKCAFEHDDCQTKQRVRKENIVICHKIRSDLFRIDVFRLGITLLFATLPSFYNPLFAWYCFTDNLHGTIQDIYATKFYIIADVACISLWNKSLIGCDWSSFDWSQFVHLVAIKSTVLWLWLCRSNGTYFFRSFPQ